MYGLCCHVLCIFTLFQVLLSHAYSAPNISESVKNAEIQPRWIDDETLEFILEDHTKKTKWRIAAVSGKMMPITSTNTDEASRPLTYVDRTALEGSRAFITFINKLDIPLQLFWIDHKGMYKKYGTILSNQTSRWSTFGGHVWSLLDSNHQVVAQYIADDTDSTAIINQDIRNRWSALNLYHHPKHSKTNLQSSQKQQRVFIRDHNMWSRTSDGVEKAMTEDGNAQSPWGDLLISPDGRFVFAIKTDASQSHSIHMLEVRPQDQWHRPMGCCTKHARATSAF